MTTTYATGPAAATLRTSGIAAAVIQNAKGYIGSAILNNANLDAIADVEIVWSFATNPTAGNYLKVHFLYAADGTNAEEGTGNGAALTSPLPGCLVGLVSPAADTSTHRKLLTGIPIEPFSFTALVENSLTAQNATVTLNIYTRKDQSVG